jgi:hypothetical protein
MQWFKRKESKDDEQPRLYLDYLQSTLVNGSFRKICVIPQYCRSYTL